MDNAIYQLVKNLRRIGPNKLTLEEKLIQLWQMAVNEWNTTHEPTFLTLEEVHRAFKNKWPQIGGGEPSNDTLHLSFGYIDYTFTHNSKGQVCGGIWPKIEQKPEFPVNMTAEQIVDLACFLRREPISLKKWEENEVYISSLDRSEMEKRCQKMYYGDNKENCYYTRLQNAGISQCGIGLFEDSFISLSRSMICRLRYQHDRQSIIYCSPNVWDDLVQASLYTIMAEDLAHMYLWDEAEWCFMLAYEHRLEIFEKKAGGVNTPQT